MCSVASCEAIAEMIEEEIAIQRAAPPEGEEGDGAWLGPVLEMMGEAATGLRTDCEWSPSEAQLLEEPFAGAIIMRLIAGRTLDAFQSNMPFRGELAHLYFRYADVLRSLDPEKTTLYEAYGAHEPPANPLLPNATATALGAPEGLDDEVLEAVGERFADAHSLAAALLRAFVAHGETPPDMPTGYKDGMDIAADMCNAIAASVRPREIAEDPNHPLAPLLFTESDLLLIRAHTMQMGRSLKAWAKTQPLGRTQALAESAGEALMTEEIATQEIAAEDAGALAMIAAELDAMLEGLADSPFYGDELRCMVTAASNVTDHYQRAAMTAAELRPGEYVPGRQLTPPPPDLMLLRLEELLEFADTDIRTGVVAGFIRSVLFAADVLAGTALIADRDDDHRALMAAASTAERRARKLMMGPEMQDEPYDEPLPVIIR